MVRSRRSAITIRYETKGQLDRWRKAATIRRWSLNEFLLAAAEHYADKVFAEPETCAMCEKAEGE